MDAALMLDSLVTASVAGCVVLTVALGLARRARHVSGHIRHQALAYALLTCLGVSRPDTCLVRL